MTDLAQHIQQTPLIDTHEHLRSEQEYVENGPDVLADLFGNYVPADLITAGASPQAINALLDSSNPDIAARWNGVKEAWSHCQFTGYGEAVRLIAQDVYGMEEITLAGIEAGAEINRQRRQPGERLRILRDEGNLDHVQIDDFVWACLPDQSGVDFFLYDLSWVAFCNGTFSVASLHHETGCEVHDLNSLRQAMAALFAKYGPNAIAVKSQHAYERTLRWQERSESDVAPVLARHLRGVTLTEQERLCLGDWCLARGVELSIEYNLPFKIHTGYYAGNDRMPVERIKPGNLCRLLARYLDAKFVLMHIAYPYDPEVAALAKHFRNVYVDLCWAWSIDPYSAGDFVRRFIHTVPINKLFVFGGDTGWPSASVAYAKQARRWLTRALQAEINDGMLTEAQAIRLATRLMRDNQRDCFDIDGTRAALRAAAG
ncbi:MAG TPA: amidohydrolase family protein [Spirillospora sp.]|nr:amidohydrolase family protein [Spirillospora sp.]